MIVRRHAGPLLTLAVITVFWLLPLLANLSTVLPGAGAGDNVTFVWNLWWMRYVLHHSGQSFFVTSFLFYPIGVDLTLHTHTALPALVAALAGPSSLIASQNLLIVLHIYLNFLCSYALAYRTTGRVLPALVGALIFGMSSFVSAHLPGHFNLIAAWTLPLGCLLAWDAREGASVMRGVLAGLALAMVAYIDYYLFVYAVGVVALCWLAPSVHFSLRTSTPSRRRQHLLVALAVLLLIDAVIVIGILLWHGDRLDLGPLRISVRSVSNPITGAWILLLVVLVAGWPKVGIGFSPAALWTSHRAAIAVMATTAMALSPLVIHAARVWYEGRYVSQTYLWRSAPGGIDVASLFLGNPFHAVWGEHVRNMYAAMRIDQVEASGWMPVSALILAAAALVSRMREPAVRQWAIAGAVFTMWALGPWLTAFGRQTPLILPAMLVRFVPIVANARIPGRAMIVVHLALAMLAAAGIAWLTSRGRWARIAAWGLALMLIVECLPARPPFYTPETPAKYLELKGLAQAGAVCELPLGVRDGFGETGSFDAAVLLHQSIHERPIVGGFAARLPPTVVRDYLGMPVIGSFLRLSSGGKLSDERTAISPRDAAGILASTGIAFVVLDTRRASPDLTQYVETRIALRSIGEQDGRIFYEVSRAGH